MGEMILWSPGVTLDNIEKQVILKAFAFYRNKKTTTANALGIAIRTLDNKLAQYEEDKKKEVANHAERQRERKEFNDRQRGVTTSFEGGVLSQRPLSSGSANTEVAAPSISGTGPGVRMESAIKVESKPPMPMPERKEVQKVLPKDASKNSPKKDR